MLLRTDGGTIVFRVEVFSCLEVPHPEQPTVQVWLRGALLPINVDGTADDILKLVVEGEKTISLKRTTEQADAMVRYACRLNTALKGEPYH